MKKRVSFFLCLLILFIASASIFYLGWTQFKVPPGSIGILISKTGGTNEFPIVRGKFAWNWEFLLPTNARILIFDVAPHSFEKTIFGSLPSAKEYESVFEKKADFSYKFTFKITLKCTPQEIVSLVKDGHIFSQNDLDVFLEDCAKTIAKNATDEMLSALLSKKINAAFDSKPFFENAKNQISSCEVVSAILDFYSFPDLDLYESAKILYGAHEKKIDLPQKEVPLAKEDGREKQDDFRFGSALKKIEILGETLKKYPELSDIIKNAENVSKTLKLIEEME